MESAMILVRGRRLAFLEGIGSGVISGNAVFCSGTAFLSAPAPNCCYYTPQNPMSCLGVHFSIDEAEVGKLRACSSDRERLAYLQDDLEERLLGSDLAHAV